MALSYPSSVAKKCNKIWITFFLDVTPVTLRWVLHSQKSYCQAQSQPQLSWTELALFSLWRTYAAQLTGYAAQPTAYAVQPTAYAAQTTAYDAQAGAYGAQPK